jgi:hypothetical protein
MSTPAVTSTQSLSPDQLANQLFDAAIVQFKSDPREAARQVVVFLTSSLIYAICATAGDEAARKALLKSVGDGISATPTSGKPCPDTSAA